ncbi:MAG TPA: hypothetical protein DHV14_09260 [Micrococcales bacterium]|nr:hypothetical protein [Micrococcales bacterium]
MFAGSALATLRAGAAEMAWVAAGGGLRVSGPQIDAETLARVRALPEVAAAATVTTTSATVRTGGTQGRAQLVLVDPEAYAAVIEGVPASVGAPELPGRLTEAGPDLPVVVSPALGAEEGEGGVEIVPNERSGVVVLGSARALPGVAGESTSWVLADVAAYPELAAQTAARVLLVRPAPDLTGAEVDALAARVLEVTGPAAVASAADARADALEAPVVGLLRATMVATVGAAALLGVAALLLVRVARAPATALLTARLRVLGVRRRTERALGWWALLPWVTLAGVVAVGLGLALTALLVPVLGLEAFTGSPTSGPVPSWLGLLTALVAAPVAAAAVTLLTSGVRGVDPVRSGEEE